MSTLDSTRSHRRRLSAVAVVDVVARAHAILRGMRDLHDARTAVRQLRSLSDEQLKDIGMHRSQIGYLARGISVPWTRSANAED